MPLIDQAQEFVTRLSHLKQLKTEMGKLERYATRREQLHRAKLMLVGLADIVDSIRAKGISPTIEMEEALSLKIKTLSHLKLFIEDKKTLITENRDSSYAFWKPLDAYPSKINPEVHKAYVSYIKSKMPSIDDEILKVLEKVPGFGGYVNAVRIPFTSLQKMTATQINEMPDFEKIDALAEQLRKAWNALESGSIPKEVLNFLKAVHLGSGVSLELLNPVVLEWLKEKELLGRYRIAPRQM